MQYTKQLQKHVKKFGGHFLNFETWGLLCKKLFFFSILFPFSHIFSSSIFQISIAHYSLVSCPSHVIPKPLGSYGCRLHTMTFNYKFRCLYVNPPLMSWNFLKFVISSTIEFLWFCCMGFVEDFKTNPMPQESLDLVEKRGRTKLSKFHQWRATRKCEIIWHIG